MYLYKVNTQNQIENIREQPFKKKGDLGLM
ncbi:hypothetical protein DJ95_123 [Bacillus atrophaeus subsp. globigii]|nr:hypothetical protein DJ95_123 [Bacillus atrophaeus subsp. globigii]KFK81259.1 hypothetical protein DK44_3510 [Bacillus atrophaeus]